MTQKVISAGRTIESVAYDLALALATKEPEINSPYVLVKRIADLMPECVKATKQQYSDENPIPPAGLFIRKK